MLVTAAQMREIDRRTIADVGIPGIVLMERAALGAVEVLVELFAPSPTRIAVLCGGGNNGGDGFAMARMLAERGHEVWVGALRSGYHGDAALNLAILEALDVEVAPLHDLTAGELFELLEDVPPCTVWVDALLGTGLDRDVDGNFAAAIDFLNTQPSVLSVDIPSGIDADSGAVRGAAVRANVTVSLGLPKLGHALCPGREFAGELFNVDIGLPAKVIDQVGWTAEWLTDAPRFGRRPATMHKGDAGRVAIVGGTPGMSGSVAMAANAAYRSGVGLVTVGTYDEVVEQVPTRCPEAMAAAVVARTNEQRHVDALDELLEWADVVVIGPGLGAHDGAFEALEAALASGQTVVADADALTMLAERRLTVAPPEVLILTPHPGEAARLCGCAIADIVADPVRYAIELADEWDALVVLKGAATVVAYDGRLAINATGNAGMATAGMGDALCGIIAAQLASRVDHEGDLFERVCLAVWAHGAAGDLARDAHGERGVTVTTLLEQLGEVWRGRDRERA